MVAWFRRADFRPTQAYSQPSYPAHGLTICCSPVIHIALALINVFRTSNSSSFLGAYTIKKLFPMPHIFLIPPSPWYTEYILVGQDCSYTRFVLRLSIFVLFVEPARNEAKEVKHGRFVIAARLVSQQPVFPWYKGRKNHDLVVTDSLCKFKSGPSLL